MLRIRAPRLLALLALGLLWAGSTTEAQIERLDLRQIVERTDDAVFGEIVSREVTCRDHPVDGPELYFTHLTIEGRSVRTGEPQTVVVTFPGGFIDEERGVWNSEAPAADDVQLGNRVVAFHRYTENMGGGLAARTLYASHGGLYRTYESGKGRVVLGRGEGYAIANNRTLDSLDQEVRTIDREFRRRGDR